MNKKIVLIELTDDECDKELYELLEEKDCIISVDETDDYQLDITGRPVIYYP